MATNSLISKQEIDRLAIESYEWLTNRSKDSNMCLFYRIGFEAGFRKAQELERFSMQMEKTPVEVNIDTTKLQDVDKFLEQFNVNKGSPVEDVALKLAKATERRIFEIMTECKAKKCYVVDFGPEYDGSTARWMSYVTCDEKEAQFKAKLHHVNYNEHDFTNLLEMTDEEFECLVMEGVSRENRNDDVVRKWRDLMKQQTKEQE